MDTVEMTFRVDRPFAERLRADPEERDRYEAFLRLVGAAKTRADYEEAIAFFTAPPSERQRLLIGAFDKIGRKAEEAGVTPEEVEEELAAWKRERSAL